MARPPMRRSRRTLHDPSKWVPPKDAVAESGGRRRCPVHDAQPAVDPPPEASAQSVPPSGDASAAEEVCGRTSRRETRVRPSPGRNAGGRYGRIGRNRRYRSVASQRHGQGRRMRERGRLANAAAAVHRAGKAGGVSPPQPRAPRTPQAAGGWQTQGTATTAIGKRLVLHRKIGRRARSGAISVGQERHGDERQEWRGNFQGKPKRERPAEKQPDPNSPFAKLLALKQQSKGATKGERQ